MSHGRLTLILVVKPKVKSRNSDSILRHKSKVLLSVEKILLLLFWNAQGIILTAYLIKKGRERYRDLLSKFNF